MSCYCHLKPISDVVKCKCGVHYICSLCGTCYYCNHKAVYSKTSDQWYWHHPTGTRTKIIGPDYGQSFV